MKSSCFKDRRNCIFDKMLDNSILILFSDKLIMSNNGNNYNYEVNRNFFYLTGINQEDTILVMIKENGNQNEYIFSIRDDDLKIKWTGRSIPFEKIKQISDINNIIDNNDTNNFIFSKLNNLNINNIYLDINNITNNLDKNISFYKFEELKTKFPFITFHNIKNEIHLLRQIKNCDEIDNMKKANKSIEMALCLVMKSIKDGFKEIEVESLIDYIVKKDGLTLPFQTIVASGKNATTLHYDKAAEVLKDGELVLIDCGSAYECLASDVSRTYPVNGKFSARQKEIYNIVLKANKTVIKNAKPGVTLNELNDLVIDIYEEELKKIGLINTREEVSDYYYHFISHFIGLECHDPFDRFKPLVKGNVITVEPGLYIEDEGIGIRIEDDVLITENGHEVLTSGIIKEVDDIEGFMECI